MTSDRTHCPQCGSLAAVHAPPQKIAIWRLKLIWWHVGCRLDRREVASLHDELVVQRLDGYEGA